MILSLIMMEGIIGMREEENCSIVGLRLLTIHIIRKRVQERVQERVRRGIREGVHEGVL